MWLTNIIIHIVQLNWFIIKYIDSSEEINGKDPKFKIAIFRISKYKIFAKGYTPNCEDKVFVINKVKNPVPWIYVISDLNGEEIVGTIYEKELLKTKQEVFRIEKVIKRKGNKLYVKWKGWIDKKDIVWMSEYFPKLRHFGGRVKVGLDLSNYATKANLKSWNRCRCIEIC